MPDRQRRHGFCTNGAHHNAFGIRREDVPPLGSSPVPDCVIPELNSAGKKGNPYMKTETSLMGHFMNRSFVRLLILRMTLALALTWFPLLPQARAQCREGCDIPNGNTFLGTLALPSNTTGAINTAIGFAALERNRTASSNTAIGADTLSYN